MGLNYDPNEFDTWRPNYEASQAFVCVCGSVGFLIAGLVSTVPGIMYFVSVFFAAWFLMLFPKAYARWKATRSLIGGEVPWIDYASVIKILSNPVHRGQIWLGRGFVWTAKHTRLISELLKRDLAETQKTIEGWAPVRKYIMGHLALCVLMPWKAVANYRETRKLISEQIGMPFIHGVGIHDEDKFQKMGHAEGHYLIFGTTGSGKTRCFDSFVMQCAFRGEATFILDPKGDKDLRDKAMYAAKLFDRPFVYFHPADPEKSIRINLIGNWTRPTEPASRIAGLLAADSESDPFTGFAWQAINTICQALVYTYHAPTLRNLRHFLEAGVEGLVIETMEAYLRLKFGDDEGAKVIKRLYANLKSQATVLKAKALIQYYRDRCNTTDQAETAKKFADNTIDGLIVLYEHDAEHFSKMITSLLPIMSMLTSNHLGDMLSPSEEGVWRKKLSFTDTRALIAKQAIVYVGLDVLSDKKVGSAIGSLFLADLAAVAGARYDFEVPDAVYDEKDRTKTQATVTEIAQRDADEAERRANASRTEAVKDGVHDFLESLILASDEEKVQKDLRPVNVFVDEAAEVVNSPFIQILNKGRGAKMRLYVATQTYADFVARMGNKPNADQMMANLNNIICLRCPDPDTQDFISRRMYTTSVKKLTRSQSSTIAGDSPANRGGSISERLDETTDVPIFAPSLIGMLPNLEYIAILSGGNIIKGRYYIILKDKSEYRHG